MTVEDDLPGKADTVLAQLLGQDLDPLSLDELEARIGALEQEIARVRLKIESSVNHKATAEALFRK